MAVGNVKGFKVKKGSETGIAKIATEAYLDGSVTKAKLATAVQDTLDEVPNKADANGDYDDLTAGGAKQLLSTVYVEDKVPYNFRTSGGTADIGDRMYDEVVGGTVVWNQRKPKNGFEVTGGVISVNNGIATWTAESKGQQVYHHFSGTNLVSNHVYFTTVSFKTTTPTTSVYARMYQRDFPAMETTGWQTASSVWKGTLTIVTIGIQDNRESDWDAIQAKDFMWIDLTQMFGSTIADYIYSLEQGTEGAGVAWFRNLFPKPYYEYNAGELMSVKAGSHDTVGFNAWDEETEVGSIDMFTGALTNMDGALRTKNYIKVVPSMNYHLTTASSIVRTNMAVMWYNSEYGYIKYDYCGNSTVTSPPDAMYAKFYWSAAYGGTYLHDTSFHLAWDGERNGEYEPYEKHTYPLSNIELRGIPKLDANNQLYYDGDTYASDGTVTRKYGIVDLGTLSWSTTPSQASVFYANIPNTRTGDNKNVITKPYPKVDGWNTFLAYDGNAIHFDSNTNTYIKDTAYTDASAFKTAMSGVYLVYELATPTTETADAFTNPQVVNDFGTEEYTDYAVEAGDRDVAIPVGHNSQYMNNLRAKLEMAPDSPDGDGDYIVRQSNGENSYVPYTADGRLTALEAKLAAPPSTNGTYKLIATVTDGGVTYTWTAG